MQESTKIQLGFEVAKKVAMIIMFVPVWKMIHSHNLEVRMKKVTWNKMNTAFSEKHYSQLCDTSFKRLILEWH